MRNIIRKVFLLAFFSLGFLFAIHPNDGKKKEEKPVGERPFTTNDTLLANVWLDSARYFLSSPHPENAVQYVHRTIELSRSLNFEPGMVNAYLVLSDLYGSVSMRTDQLQLISLAGEWSAGKNLNDLNTLSGHKLADYYLSLHDLSSAETAYQKVFEKYRSSSDSVGMALVLASLGDIHRERNELSDAGHLYQDALRIQVRYHQYQNVTETYLKLVQLEMEGDHYQEARRYLSGAERFVPYSQDSSLHLLTGIAFVKYYLAGKHFDSAIHVSAQLRSGFGQQKVSQPYVMFLQQLYKVHAEMEDHSGAWAIYQEYTAHKLELERMDDRRRAEIFSALSGLDDVAMELASMNQRIEDLKAQESTLNSAMIAMVILLLSGGIGGFVFHGKYEHLSRIAQRMQQRVSRQSHYLDDTNRFLEEFSYMTAHDLRSPVTNLLGLLSIVRRDEIADADNHTHYLALKQGSYRMLHVLNSLNDILRIRQLSSEKPEWIDLNQLTQGMAGQIKNELDDFPNPVQVTSETGPSVLYPRRQLESILHSLLMFSALRIKGHPEATVWITAANEGAFSRITCAFPVQTLTQSEASRVFDLGECLGNSGDEFPTGLYNVQLLASAHGGSASVSEMAGGGNLFTVLIRNFAS